MEKESDRERKVREELKGINKMENGDKERWSKPEEKWKRNWKREREREREKMKERNKESERNRHRKKWKRDTQR